MNRQRALHTSAPSPEQAHRSLDGPRRLVNLSAGTVQRDWLTMAQLAEHGKFMTRDGRFFSPEAARKFVTRHRDLPHGRRGRQLIVDRGVFDRFVVAQAEAAFRAHERDRRGSLSASPMIQKVIAAEGDL